MANLKDLKEKTTVCPHSSTSLCYNACHTRPLSHTRHLKWHLTGSCTAHHGGAAWAQVPLATFEFSPVESKHSAYMSPLVIGNNRDLWFLIPSCSFLKCHLQGSLLSVWGCYHPSPICHWTQPLKVHSVVRLPDLQALPFSGGEVKPPLPGLWHLPLNHTSSFAAAGPCLCPSPFSASSNSLEENSSSYLGFTSGAIQTCLMSQQSSFLCSFLLALHGFLPRMSWPPLRLELSAFRHPSLLDVLSPFALSFPSYLWTP